MIGPSQYLSGLNRYILRQCLSVMFFVTGALTASGGSWNAAQVSELVSWGHTEIRARGLGSYIADAAAAHNFHQIVLGVGVTPLKAVAQAVENFDLC